MEIPVTPSLSASSTFRRACHASTGAGHEVEALCRGGSAAQFLFHFQSLHEYATLAALLQGEQIVTHLRRTAAVAASTLLSAPALAHHSFVEFDQDKVVEIRGILTEVRWQNPHIGLTVRVAQGGRDVLWDIEGHSVSVLRRTNVTPESLKVGDLVTVAGNPSRRINARMFAVNLLPSRGPELVLEVGGKPRWRQAAAGTVTTWTQKATPGDATKGIFRIWATRYGERGMDLWQRNYPLTAEARAVLARWNPDRGDTVARGCEPKGMPTIMEQPYPIEFVKESDAIILRMEEYDTVRRIELSKKPSPGAPPRLLGYSTGRWDGRTLIVTTSGISWTHFDVAGVPLAPGASAVEHFTPTEDGARLEYTITVTDPRTFTQPVELRRNWAYDPNERIKPYKCGAKSEK
jgi:hypothetical protein